MRAARRGVTGLDSFSESGVAEGAIFFLDMTFEPGDSIAVGTMAKIGRSGLQSGVKEYDMGRIIEI